MSVTVAKGGKLNVRVWSNQDDAFITNEASDMLLYHLNDSVAIEDNVTLRDIMLLVRPFCDVLSPIVTKQKQTLHSIVDECLNHEPKSKSKLHYLRLKWVLAVDDFGDGGPQLHKFAMFDGIGDPSSDKYPDDVEFSVSFTPTNEMADLPIRLDEKAVIHDERVQHNPSKILTATHEFRLFDVLLGIFWELSFHGDPTSRGKVVSDLMTRIDSIE